MTGTILFRPPGEEHRTPMHELRHRVYTKYGYLSQNGVTVDVDDYDPHSVHFVATVNDQVFGTIRLIRSSSPQGFPVEQYFGIKNAPFARVDRFQVVEVSRLAVEKTPPGVPKHAVMLGLIKTIFTYCKDRGWIYWYLAADTRVLGLLRRFHFAITPLSEGQKYLGSHTIPAFINIRAGIRYLEVENPDLADFFLSSGVTPPKFAWYEFLAVP